MNRIDFIKRIITEGTITRDQELSYKETEVYYNDIVQALNIENFPLISINTIKKKTYMLQASDGQCYLVFDHYLLEYMHLLNQFVIEKDKSLQVEALFYKIMSEECFSRHKMGAAIHFAGEYMNNIDYVIQDYMEERVADHIPSYLFVQQAFLIAHELFHFFIHKNPNYDREGIQSKRRFLNRIYNYVLDKNADTAAMIKKAVDETDMAEECLCDSTAMIQGIDVGIKTGKMDIVDCGVSAGLALMNQYTISTIQDTVKHSGDMTYERLQNLFNFRIVHLKAFTDLYIKEYGSSEKARLYQYKVEQIYKNWFEKVNTPIMHLLVKVNRRLKEEPMSVSGSEKRKIIDTLRAVYNS